MTKDNTLYKAIVIGGGIAALEFLYKQKLRGDILWIHDEFLYGQLNHNSWVLDSDDHQVPTTEIKGSLYKQIRAQEQTKEVVGSVFNLVYDQKDEIYLVSCTGSRTKYKGLNVIIATGRSPKRMDGFVPYLSYPALSAGTSFLEREKIVVIVGAGRTGQTAAKRLIKKADEIYLLDKRPITKEVVDEFVAYPNVHFIESAQYSFQFDYSKHKYKLTYETESETNQCVEEIDSLLVAIGYEPNKVGANNFPFSWIDNEQGPGILTGPNMQVLYCPKGMFALGDVRALSGHTVAGAKEDVQILIEKGEFR